MPGQSKNQCRRSDRRDNRRAFDTQYRGGFHPPHPVVKDTEVTSAWELVNIQQK